MWKVLCPLLPIEWIGSPSVPHRTLFVYPFNYTCCILWQSLAFWLVFLIGPWIEDRNFLVGRIRCGSENGTVCPSYCSASACPIPLSYTYEYDTWLLSLCHMGAVPVLRKIKLILTKSAFPVDAFLWFALYPARWVFHDVLWGCPLGSHSRGPPWVVQCADSVLSLERGITVVLRSSARLVLILTQRSMWCCGKSPDLGVRWSVLSLTPPPTKTVTSCQHLSLAETQCSHSWNGNSASGSACLAKL